MASIIGIALLYDAGYSIVLLRPKNEVKPHSQSAESGFVWGNGLYQIEGIYFSGFKKAQDVQIFQGVRLLPMPSLKK